MFKKLKEKKQQFDESKTGSIIKLSIWIILIIILASFTRTNTSNIPQKKEVIIKPTSTSIKTKMKNINSYEADVNIDDITIHYTNYIDKYLITYNGETYYKTDNIYLLKTKEIVDDNILNEVTYYNIKNIALYIENIDEDYMTIYKDNSYQISFTIPVNEQGLTFEENQNNVNIIIKGNETINEIEINNIKLNIKNINNIEDIEVD